MLDGKFKHKDNKGHAGEIGKCTFFSLIVYFSDPFFFSPLGPGDVQWMTAGSGVIHSEMPGTDGVNHGLQLWVNLQKKDKMVPANYQELPAAKIPNPKADGVSVHIIAGEALGEKAPSTNEKQFSLSPLVTHPSFSVYTRTPAMYIDIELKAGKTYRQAIPSSFNGTPLSFLSLLLFCLFTRFLF
jgi:redox-sensitive bicupin YhaK (pirin superfamily)